ncbi:MAG: hypothetical protein KKD64_04540 [Alphaproteobacteria bacterium]|nr:hypothetical protein [Alphaproteobacteria bacterium]MBU0792982.1 hypothetical protein [Alphaproteobacteria bacterium]MBU0875152.1 hypothetical protein [Alphaproteobacteria bacterium]MBU1768901.1 hypothetical protein [Alphaproteobacteria bacterium]
MASKTVTLVIGAALWAVLSGASSAQPPQRGGLASLEPGEWELLERGRSPSSRRLCISEGSQLLQPQHPHRQCERYVIRQSPREVAASYDCGEGGRGRTDVRIETSRLVQISSQGVSEGLPFSLAMEGRRIGACRSAALAR